MANLEGPRTWKKTYRTLTPCKIRYRGVRDPKFYLQCSKCCTLQNPSRPTPKFQILLDRASLKLRTRQINL